MSITGMWLNTGNYEHDILVIMKKIAVIGTGIMGSGIVTNFLKNDYRVLVWNRSKDKLDHLIDKGAISVNSPKEAIEQADILFEVTANNESSRSVWLDKDGILAGASQGKVLITCATLAPAWIDELISECHNRGFTFFDMPMTGSRIGAETGNLTLLVGGDQDKLKEVESDLKAISGKIIYFGKAGSGMRFKLLLNMLQAIHVEALGEALRIAKEVGLDLVKVGESLAERPGGVVTKLAWESYQKEPSQVNFSVEWITKDLNYAKQLAEKLKTPLLDEVLEKYTQISNNKLQQKDWTVVVKV